MSVRKEPASCVAVLCATAIGTGVLVLPKTMAAVGILPALLILTLAAAVSAISTYTIFRAVASQQGARAIEAKDMSEELLHDSAVSARMITYADLLELATAPWVGAVLDVILIVYGHGSLVTYFLFITDFVHQIGPGDFVWPLSKTITIVALAAIVYVPTLPARVTVLSRLSFVVLVSLVTLTFGVAVNMPHAMAMRVTPVRTVGELQYAPEVLCVAVFAMMWHTNAVGVARDLDNPTPARCAVTAIAGAGSIVVIYAICAVMGYLSWGDAVSSDIVAMYPRNDALFTVIRVLLSCSLLLVIPVNIFPIRESIFGLVRKVAVVAPGEPGFVARALCSAGVVVLSAVIAIVYPDVVEIISLLGGLLATCLCVIFPALISRLILSQRAWKCALVAAAVLTVLLWSSAVHLIGKSIPK